MKKWYETSYRRNLVDMHIDDWHDDFLSQFDPQQYYDCLQRGHIQSPMIYLQSHVGLCNWPTRSGKMHAGFRGRNKIRELIDLCHGGGLDVIGYYSLIYNNWAYDQHPQWRMRDRDGNPSRDDRSSGFAGGGRYGLLCPNHAQYREFIFRQFAELLDAYPVEGMFLDMTFWPMVCHCEQCKRRFLMEAGQEIPGETDWRDPLWRQFQAARERWLGEFAAACTAELKRLRPGLPVEHQLSTIHQHWLLGVNWQINEASDYAGGDLYGGHGQQSFICKLYYEITKNQPFEYMTSRCDPDLADHTTTKSPDVLRLHNFLTLAHHGAMLFIDAIDPRGTINAGVYDAIGRVFAESMPYEKFLTGQMVADVAIYFSLDSKMNAHARRQPDHSNPQLDAAVGAAVALAGQNHLCTVIPSSRQEKIAGKRVVVVCEAVSLSEAEIDRFADYVERGGSLYLSGDTDERLANRLLGLEFLGHTDECVTYLAPTPAGQALFGEMYTANYPLAYRDAQVKAANPLGREVLATVTLPYTDPQDKTRFASIHSNPPGVRTDLPAVVYGRYGKGRVIWSAAAFEKNPQAAHKDVFLRMIGLLYGGEPLLRSTAPAFVQFTLFEEEQDDCLYLNVVNVQEQHPPVPAGDFQVSLRIGKPVKAVHRLPEETAESFTQDGGLLTFAVQGLDIFAMYRIRR